MSVFIVFDNQTVWYKDDSHHKAHRIDGPAVERCDGTKYWYYEGLEINVSSQEEFEQWLKYKVFL